MTLRRSTVKKFSERPIYLGAWINTHVSEFFTQNLLFMGSLAFCARERRRSTGARRWWMGADCTIGIYVDDLLVPSLPNRKGIMDIVKIFFALLPVRWVRAQGRDL